MEGFSERLVHQVDNLTMGSLRGVSLVVESSTMDVSTHDFLVRNYLAVRGISGGMFTVGNFIENHTGCIFISIILPR